jgi:hypothetical protein
VVLGCAWTWIVAAACAGQGLLPEQETALLNLAHGRPASWRELTPAQAALLLERAEAHLANYRQYHQPQGLCADILWKDKTRAEASRYEGIGDSACWTGHYLAACAFRYSVTKDERTKDEILAVLKRFDVLTRVTGTDGYIARYTGPADSPPFRAYYSVYGRGEDPNRPGLGTRAYRGEGPFADLVWLGDSSRDAYDGVLFGWAATWACVREPPIRGLVATLVERVVDRLKQDGWAIVDKPHGIRTRPTPLFKAAWMRLALSVNPSRYASLENDYPTSVDWLMLWGIGLHSKWQRDYFVNNLAFVQMFALCTLETNPRTRSQLRGLLRDAFEKQARDHLNAHFAAIYMAGTGDSRNTDARATLQGMLVEFPPPPLWTRVVDHRKDAAIEAHGDDLTEYALLMRDRVPTDFAWQRSPCARHGGSDSPLEYPGIDCFLPYWMGRAIGAIPAPEPQGSQTRPATETAR